MNEKADCVPSCDDRGADEASSPSTSGRRNSCAWGCAVILAVAFLAIAGAGVWIWRLNRNPNPFPWRPEREWMLSAKPLAVDFVESDGSLLVLCGNGTSEHEAASIVRCDAASNEILSTVPLSFPASTIAVYPNHKAILVAGIIPSKDDPYISIRRNDGMPVAPHSIIPGTQYLTIDRSKAKLGNFPGMARLARLVVPGMPHHITQRGNRRQPTFFCDDDYAAYLDLMATWCGEQGVEIRAYCLMPNHAHLIAVPQTEDGLRRALGEAHRRLHAACQLPREVAGLSLARAVRFVRHRRAVPVGSGALRGIESRAGEACGASAPVAVEQRQDAPERARRRLGHGRASSGDGGGLESLPEKRDRGRRAS